MKNKILPFGFLAIIIGFSAFFLSSAGIKSEQKYIQGKNLGSEISQNKQKADSYFTKIRNNQITGKINPNDVLKVREQIAKNKTKSGNANELNWVEIGPDNFASRTRALIFDNQDAVANTIYAGSVTGGIWKSTNIGSSWNQVNTNNGSACLAVSCLAQSTDGIIYAGTGEGITSLDYSEFGGLVGSGLYKSTDGDNFELVPGTNPEITQDNDTVDWAFINEIAIDNNSGRIYAATNTGLKYRDQGSETWVTPNFIHDSTFYQISKNYTISCDSIEINGDNITMYGPDTTAVTIDTTSSNVVTNEFILTGNSLDVKVYEDGAVIAFVDDLTFTSNNGELFTNIAKYPTDPHFITKSFSTVNNDLVITNRSDTTYSYNDSINWAPNPGSIFYLPNNSVGRIEFAIAPSDQNIIYANVITSIGYLYNIYKSDNKGKTWKIILPGDNDTYRIFNGQGIYSNTITVYPNNPDKVLVGGLNLWQGTKYDEGFYQWQEKSSSFLPRLFTYFLPSGHHTYVFRPGSPNQFLIGSDGGISISLNGDEEFMLKIKNYNTAQFHSVSFSVNKKEVLGGSQDNGILHIRGEGDPAVSKNANQIIRGHGGYTAMSLINPNAYIFKIPQVGDNENIFRSETKGDDVSNTFLGSGMESSEYINPFILWESFTEQKSKDSIKFYARQNNYDTFDTIQARSNNFEYPFDYILPHALNAGDSIMVKDIIQSKFFWAQNNKAFMTTEILDFASAPTWFQISEFSGTPQSIALSADANFLYVGTQEGKLFRISNISYAFTYKDADIESPYCIISTNEIPIIHAGDVENTQAITSVYVDPQDANKVIITLGNYGNTDYVYLSTNCLDQYPEFHSIQGDPDDGGLPQMPVYSSIIEMENSNLAIIGTEKGVYVSNNIFDVSPIWEKQSNSILDTPVFMIKQQIVKAKGYKVTHHDPASGNTSYEIFPPTYNYGYIYVAAYGRGIFVDNSYHPVGIDDDGFENNNKPEISLFPNPVIDHVTVSFELTKSANTLINIYDLTGKLVKSIDLQREPAGNINCKIDVKNLRIGTYILHLISGEKQTSTKFIVTQ